MSDNLRARIAAVAQHCREHKPEHECVCSMPPTDWDYELADAVIRELSLRHVIDYCERQAVVGWRDVGTADEAMGRNIVAESVLNILEGVTQNG